MTERRLLSFCYLCGKPLDDDSNVDHVPPKQFFAGSIRKFDNSLKLLTLPTHKKCNVSYQLDEDYFIASIGPLVMEHSLAGKELWKDIAKRIRRPEGAPLAALVRKEFSNKIGSLYLPNGKSIKSFDPKRVWRIIWKITRGLFTYETGRFLPEGTPNFFRSQQEIGKGIPPEEFFQLNGTPIKGNHKGIFAYRYLVDNDLNAFNIWSMLLWDAWIVVVGFHDPDCPCEICSKSKSIKDNL